MAGRLQVLVLVVAVAAQPSMQLGLNDILYGVADRCRNTVGEKASVDFLNMVNTLAICTRSEELYGEGLNAYRTKGLKEAVKTVCRRKNELLPCFNQAFETIRRCLNEEEEQGLTILQEGIEPAMDFVCEHDDEIAAIYGSTEEQQCLVKSGAMFDRCNPYKSKGSEEMLDSLKSLKQECKKLDEFVDCSITENCKDSAVARLIKDIKREVVDDAVCSKKVQVSSAAAALARVGILPEPLGRLILAVTVPYILRF